MLAEPTEDVGDKLALLYAEWVAAIRIAARELEGVRPGQPFGGPRRSRLEQAEARAATITQRYWALSQAVSVISSIAEPGTGTSSGALSQEQARPQ